MHFTMWLYTKQIFLILFESLFVCCFLQVWSPPIPVLEFEPGTGASVGMCCLAWMAGYLQTSAMNHIWLTWILIHLVLGETWNCNYLQLQYSCSYDHFYFWVVTIALALAYPMHSVKMQPNAIIAFLQCLCLPARSGQCTRWWKSSTRNTL